MNINISAPTRIEYYEKFLTIVSALSPQPYQLSPLEAEILARFMDLPQSYRFYPFSPKARKMVNKSLPLPYSTQNLSIKICKLLDKRYLTKDEDNFLDFSPSIKQIIESKNLNVSLQHRPSNTKDSESSEPPTRGSQFDSETHV